MIVVTLPSVRHYTRLSYGHGRHLVAYCKVMDPRVRITFFGGLAAMIFALACSVTPGLNSMVALTGETAQMNDQTGNGTTSDPYRTTYEPDLNSLHIPCPLSSSGSSPYAFVVDFTRGGTVSIGELTIVANGSDSSAKRVQNLLTTNIPAGVYRVSLASYDEHSVDSRWYRQPREQWTLMLYGSDGKLLLTTPAIHDIADMESSVFEMVMSSTTVSAPGAKAVAMHAAFPDPNSTQELAPLCARFERMGDLPSSQQMQTPPPSYIGTSTPTNATSTATSTSVSQTQLTVPEQEIVDVYVKCPIQPRSKRTVVDFTQNGTVPVRLLTIRADSSKTEATKGSPPLDLPAGKYAIRLASYALDPKTSIPHQEWFATLFDRSERVIIKTPPSRDVPDGTLEFVSKVTDGLKIERDVAALSAMHARYPSESPSAHAVLCAAFDLVEPIVVDEVDDAGSNNALLEEEKESEVVPVTMTKTVTTDAVAPVSATSTPPKEVAPTTVAPKEVAPTTVVPKTTTAVPQPTQEKGGSVDATRKDATVQGLPEEDMEQETVLDPIFVQLNEAGRDRIDIVLPLLQGAYLASSSNTTSTTGDVLARTIMDEEAHGPEDGASREVQREGFRNRGKSEMRDTDGDGVSDYDEIHFYETDPKNPATAGGALQDGTRILLGMDPLGSTYEAIPVESPKVVEMETDRTLRVFEIAYASSSDGSRAGTSPGIVRIEGFAAPYSFVTLYLFSTPVIVTVRTDEVGMFAYEFGRGLEDGSHEVYVTTVNRSGRIIAKSEPFTFVKTAEAIEYTEPVVTYDPVDDVARKMVIIVFIVLGICGTIGLLVMGIWRSRHVDTVSM